MGNKNKQNSGFTLIELLVVIAIIALLSSIVLIALMSARQKSRDATRLGDMVQMNNALELYYAANRGYPTGSVGVPQGIAPGFASSLPISPIPPDGVCDSLVHSSDSCTTLDPSCSGVAVNTFYYAPSGTFYLAPDGITHVFPDYSYYFCLGNQTGNFSAGIHVVTPHGVQ